MMSTSGWVKHFNDGTLETGWDKDVVAKKSSWSNGRLEELNGVDLIVNNQAHSLFVPGGTGNWHQSDRYIATMEKPNRPTLAKLQYRQVQYRLTDQDVGKIVYSEDNGIFVLMPLPPNVFAGRLLKVQPIEEEHIKKWITLRLFPDGKTELKFMGRRT